MSPPPPVSSGPSAADCFAPAVGRDDSLDSERVAAIARALAEPLRVEILDVLRRSPEPVCQCELIALFHVKQPLLSHHLKTLCLTGLVTVERRHKWAYYSAAEDAIADLAAWLVPREPTR